ncbi:MAG: hypothetical protein QOH88_1246 [Verrucomicrobiota bacterium]|jgi:hypothetical protein
MTKFDQFIQRELEPRLEAEEKITVTGFLFSKSLALIALVGPLALAGSGYFFAALTPRRLFLIKTRMGLFSLKMANEGVIEIPYADINSIQRGGALNQKSITISLKDGAELKYRLNTFARQTSGQKDFIDTLCRLHAAQT